MGTFSSHDSSTAVTSTIEKPDPSLTPNIPNHVVSLAWDVEELKELIFTFLHPVQWKTIELSCKDFRNVFVRDGFRIWRKHVDVYMKNQVSPTFFVPDTLFENNDVKYFENLESHAAKNPCLWKRIVMSYYYSPITFRKIWDTKQRHDAINNYQNVLMRWKGIIKRVDLYRYEILFDKPRYCVKFTKKQFEKFVLDHDIHERKIYETRLVEIVVKLKPGITAFSTLEFSAFEQSNEVPPIRPYFSGNIIKDCTPSTIQKTSVGSYCRFFAGECVQWKTSVLRRKSPTTTDDKGVYIDEYIDDDPICLYFDSSNQTTSKLVSKNTRDLMDKGLMKYDSIEVIGQLTRNRKRISVLSLRLLESGDFLLRETIGSLVSFCVLVIILILDLFVVVNLQKASGIAWLILMVVIAPSFLWGAFMSVFLTGRYIMSRPKLVSFSLWLMSLFPFSHALYEVAVTNLNLQGRAEKLTSAYYSLLKSTSEKKGAIMRMLYWVMTVPQFISAGATTLSLFAGCAISPNLVMIILVIYVLVFCLWRKLWFVTFAVYGMFSLRRLYIKFMEKRKVQKERNDVDIDLEQLTIVDGKIIVK